MFFFSWHSQFKQFELVYRIYKAYRIPFWLNSYCLFNDGKSFTSKLNSCLTMKMFKIKVRYNIIQCFYIFFKYQMIYSWKCNHLVLYSVEECSNFLVKATLLIRKLSSSPHSPLCFKYVGKHVRNIRYYA